MVIEPIKLLTSDADGALFDTREQFTNALMAAVNDMGYQVEQPLVKNALAQGLGLHKAFSEVAPEHTPEETEERFYHFDEALGYDKIVVYDGLHMVLDYFAQNNVNVAIATNRARTSTLKILAHLGIGIDPDLVFTPTDTVRPKPEPDQILAAMAITGHPASQTVMFGDTPGDMLAGKNAGVRAKIGFTQGFGAPESLVRAGADLILDRVTELPLALWSIENSNS